jgi:hypothetical protein
MTSPFGLRKDRPRLSGIASIREAGEGVGGAESCWKERVIRGQLMVWCRRWGVMTYSGFQRHRR